MTKLSLVKYIIRKIPSTVGADLTVPSVLCTSLVCAHCIPKFAEVNQPLPQFYLPNWQGSMLAAQIPIVQCTLGKCTSGGQPIINYLTIWKNLVLAISR